jgi:hypothetical protein
MALALLKCREDRLRSEGTLRGFIDYFRLNSHGGPGFLSYPRITTIRFHTLCTSNLGYLHPHNTHRGRSLLPLLAWRVPCRADHTKWELPAPIGMTDIFFSSLHPSLHFPDSSGCPPVVPQESRAGHRHHLSKVFILLGVSGVNTPAAKPINHPQKASCLHGVCGPFGLHPIFSPLLCNAAMGIRVGRHTP